ncbi:unnamed protein product [Scytosiphon promiscuus]
MRFLPYPKVSNPKVSITELPTGSDMRCVLPDDGDDNVRKLLPSNLRSAGRSLKGRKDVSRSNEDRFVAIVDLFRVEATTAAPQPSLPKRTPPPSPSPLPSPSPSESPPSPGAGGVSPPATPALVSATVGDVGVYGVFDGHGGTSCADFVSRQLPQAIRESSAWARLAASHGGGGGGDNSKPAAAAGAPATTSPPSPPPAPGGSSTEGAEFEELLRGVMKEALLDGFEKTQEGALARCGDSGATAVVALAVRRQLVIANLGDSGGLFHVDGGTAEEGPRTIRTECHTVENPAERKRVEAAGGSFSGGRLFGRMQPTRSFGDRDIQRMQEGALIAVPELTTHQIMPTSGSAFLVLGTDGLWEGVKESKVVSVVRAETNRRRSKQKPTKAPLRVAEALAQRATKASEDDITAVVVLFQ